METNIHQIKKLATSKRKLKQDFSEFCGIWSKQEFDKFSEDIRQFEKIDDLEWK